VFTIDVTLESLVQQGSLSVSSDSMVLNVGAGGAITKAVFGGAGGRLGLFHLFGVVGSVRTTIYIAMVKEWSFMVSMNNRTRGTPL
jgi:hypothetical protein